LCVFDCMTKKKEKKRQSRKQVPSFQKIITIFTISHEMKTSQAFRARVPSPELFQSNRKTIPFNLNDCCCCCCFFQILIEQSKSHIFVFLEDDNRLSATRAFRQIESVFPFVESTAHPTPLRATLRAVHVRAAR